MNRFDASCTRAGSALTEVATSVGIALRRGRSTTLGRLGVFALLGVPVIAAAAPQEGDVRVPGSATIRVDGSTTRIDQTTERAIIDWRTFDVANGERVVFEHRTGDSGATLNRVIGGEGASTIDGEIRANGHVYIINDQGILFGDGARIDVGSLIATTADLSDVDQARFIASGLDGLTFEDGDVRTGDIVNRGEIKVREGGFAALVGPRVVNGGLIEARLGRIGLASTGQYTLDIDPSADGLITFGTDRATLERMAERNDLGVFQEPVVTVNGRDAGGRSIADGGRVAITAQGLEGVLDNVINLDGIVQANSVERIYDDGPQLDVTGEILVGLSGSSSRPSSPSLP